MKDTKLLQAILDNQVDLKKSIIKLDDKVDKGFQKVNTRLDIIGSQVAYLEDDTPTRKEHNKLKKRVTKLESQVLTP